MAITVKVKCSECSTVRELCLQPDSEQKELACPACQRRNNNLTADEYREIETVQKKQSLFCIIAMVLFVVGSVALALLRSKPLPVPIETTPPQAG